jgi:predicted 2-oxoglutarate/Fe(II)-dependent dioxygenase YbiX
VLAHLPHDAAHNAAADRLLASLPAPGLHAGVEVPAPILVLPRVFEPDFCHSLIGLYESEGGQESGFMRQIDGKTVGVYDDNYKRRRDFPFDQPPALEPVRAAIRARVQARLVPAIARAFQFQVTRMERYLVACYDAEQRGFFTAHRDNTTSGTVHRRFACTLNLNAEDYDGGDLRFPEFGPRTYRAPTGGAVVFSCSLLHEATPVTRGRRFAFLPFLYDDAAARIRAANLAAITGENIDMNAARAGGS